MGFPAFFSDVPPIVVHDRLAEFLGAADGGIIEYRYADAVKLAGHSCPTVAGAYLLTSRVLTALYPDELPERGEIQVDFCDTNDNGSTGVIASVVGLITGAASGGGFQGIAGHFSRRHLLGFEQADLAGEISFTRRDNGMRLCASLHIEQVAVDPRIAPLLQRLLSGDRDPVVGKLFAALWQNRVRRILLDHFDDPALVSLAANEY
jgi:hypothetical protein